MGPRPCAVFLVAPLAFRAPRGVLLGRAAWCARGRWPSCLCCLWPHGCSGRRRARPPARSPHASLRLGVVDLEARPCPPDPPAPSTPAVPCCCVWLSVSTRSPAVPSGPSGALHTCGAWSLCVPVGGDPPVSRPRRELRSARRLVVRPGPAAHRYRGVTRCPRVSCPALACRIAEPTLNFARNSLAALSNHELRSLELQRFGTLLRLHPIELRAIFVGGAAVTDECCGQVLGLPADRYRGLVPPL